MSIVHEDQSQSRNASLAVRGQTGRGGSECYLNLGAVDTSCGSVSLPMLLAKSMGPIYHQYWACQRYRLYQSYRLHQSNSDPMASFLS